MDGAAQQPPKQPTIEIVVTQADGSKIFDEENALLKAELDNFSDTQKKSLQNALNQLSAFSDSEELSPILSPAASDEELSGEICAWEEYTTQSKELIRIAEQVSQLVSGNYEEHERKKQQSAQTILGILTVMKQKNFELEERLSNQITDITSNVLAMHQQQIKQQHSRINDLKLEQKAIQEEFKIQYDKCYSNQLAAVTQLNKQRKDAKKELRQEIAQLRSYVKLLSASLASTICGILMWLYINAK